MELKFKNFAFIQGVKPLDVSINSGEILSIIGKNGCGKTTFMDVLYGIKKKISGEVYIEGQLLNFKRVKDNRKKISYIRQEYLNDLNCRNIAEYLKRGLNVDREDRLNSLMRFLKVKEKVLSKSSLELDETDIKKIILIKQILRNTPIILLDDPTLGLDYRSVMSLVKILKEEKRNGKTIIISSNDVEFLFMISDCFLIIDRENIYKETDKYKVFSNKSLLGRLNMKTPNIIDFEISVYKSKKVKLLYRDNIDDLIKEIYRNVETKK